MRIGIAVAIAMIGVMTGCTLNGLKHSAAAVIGCAPSEITISDKRMDFSGTDYFRATCKGQSYHCSSSASKATQCSLAR